MNTKPVPIVLLLLSALLISGCATTFDGLDLSTFLQSTSATGNWPQSRFNSVQPALSVAGESVYRTRFVPPMQANTGLMRPTRVPAADTPPAGFPRRLIQIRVGQSVQLESAHLSPSGIEAVEITVNGQPVSGEDNPFPNSLLTVRVCSTEWEGNRQVCPKGTLAQINRVEPEHHFNQQNLTLIVTGNTPGIYQLALITTHRQNEQQSQIIQTIEVVN